MQVEERDRLLSRAEVEERFGISKRYLEIAVSRREGPRFVKIGRSVRYRVGDIRAWIDHCSVDGQGV